MIQIKDEKEILNLLYEFDDVFPHNREKVTDYVGWAKKIFHNGITYAITENNEYIGIVVFYANDKKDKKGYISLIGLKSDCRGKGLGKALLDDVIKEMKKCGMCKVFLEVDNDNKNAIDFYSEYGFELEQKQDETQLLKYNI